MNKILCFIISLFGSMLLGQTMKFQNQEESYVALRYKVDMDFSLAKSFYPSTPSMIASTLYFIQYGRDISYELRVPGAELPFMPVQFLKWDYQNNVLVIDGYFNNVQKQYNTSVNIESPIENKHGDIINLCDSLTTNSECDSVIYIDSLSGQKYMVHVDLEVENIKMVKLFYPDIMNLPTRFTRINKNITTYTLEEIINGREAIDSLLSSYRQEDYSVISKEEINSYPLELPSILLDKLEPRNE